MAKKRREETRDESDQPCFNPCPNVRVVAMIHAKSQVSAVSIVHVFFLLLLRLSVGNVEPTSKENSTAHRFTGHRERRKLTVLLTVCPFRLLPWHWFLGGDRFRITLGCLEDSSGQKSLPDALLQRRRWKKCTVMNKVHLGKGESKRSARPQS